MSHVTRLAILALAAGLLVTFPAGTMAQTADEMTAEEMAEAFKKQKTRGLVIVPQGDQAASTSDSASVTPAPATEPTETAYAAVEKGDQVNIQISFDFDSAALRADQKPKLSTLCTVMQSVDVAVFQIIGHTDSSGSATYNERLSLLRAQEVKRHLVSDCGVADTRLKAIGMGESAPYNTADPRADVNRRVEFQALG